MFSAFETVQLAKHTPYKLRSQGCGWLGRLESLLSSVLVKFFLSKRFEKIVTNFRLIGRLLPSK